MKKKLRNAKWPKTGHLCGYGGIGIRTESEIRHFSAIRGSMGVQVSQPAPEGLCIIREIAPFNSMPWQQGVGNFIQKNRERKSEEREWRNR